LNKREGEIIRQIGTLNKKIEGRTKEEYRDDNKEQKKEYDKEYYQNNKNQILERCQNYRENNKEIINGKKSEKITCECGCLLSKTHVSRHQRTQKHLNLITASKTE
jgi:hypothetical protein